MEEYAGGMIRSGDASNLLHFEKWACAIQARDWAECGAWPEMAAGSEKRHEASQRIIYGSPLKSESLIRPSGGFK